MSLPDCVRSDRSGNLLLDLWIQPRASRTSWAGIHGERLKIKLNSPPVDGKANKELIRFLAKALKLPPRQIELVSGQSSRGKTVRLEGLTSQELLLRLPDHPA